MWRGQWREIRDIHRTSKGIQIELYPYTPPETMYRVMHKLVPFPVVNPP